MIKTNISGNNSVSSDIEMLYEETVRNSLKSIIWSSFRINCREPEHGFNRKFYNILNKGNNEPNFFWKVRPSAQEIEIDFIAHVSPIERLEYSGNPGNLNVTITQPREPVDTETKVNLQGKMKYSPEKEKVPTDEDGENFQYAIAEISSGRKDSVSKKLEQLEKDCIFLCSRACPEITDLNDLSSGVLQSIAFAAVVSPHKYESNFISNMKSKFPILGTLLEHGRFIYIQHKETLKTVVQEMRSKIDTIGNQLAENAAESNQSLLDLDCKISDQITELEGRLSEQMTKQTNELEGRLSEQMTKQTTELEGRLSEQITKQTNELEVNVSKMIYDLQLILERMNNNEAVRANPSL